MFQTIYCVLGVIGVLNSLGYFAADFHENFYVYYTNLSNYICLGVMFACLTDTYKKANRKEDGYSKTAPTFTFLCVILILVTFLVYNILLADENTVIEYFTSQSNMIMHVILPILFVLNWILFYEHPSLEWYHPLLATVMPLIYVVFIVIRAKLLSGAKDALLYPYFFLNIDQLGWGGFLIWIAILLAVFVVLGYIIYATERFLKRKKQ